jgi:hypothetical protein
MRTDFSRIERKAAAAGMLTLFLLVVAPALAHGDEVHAPSQTAPATAPSSPMAVADSFNRALTSGDASMVRALLLPNVLIYESGGAEASAAEYAGHHMLGDMAFLAKLKREQLSQDSGGDEATAWVATRSRLSGQFKGKEIDLNSTETLVMARTETGWRIANIHWSSAPRGDKNP